MVLPICMLTKMRCLCRYGRVMGQLERERSGDTTDKDPGGSGRPPCIGQIWGSQVFGEPFDESRGTVTGLDYQLLGSRSRDLYSAGAQDRTNGPGRVFPDWSPATGDGGKHTSIVTARVENSGIFRAPLSTGCPCERHADTDQRSREARDSCCGCTGVVDPVKPDAPPHHRRPDDTS